MLWRRHELLIRYVQSQLPLYFSELYELFQFLLTIKPQIRKHPLRSFLSFILFAQASSARLWIRSIRREFVTWHTIATCILPFSRFKFDEVAVAEKKQDNTTLTNVTVSRWSTTSADAYQSTAALRSSLARCSRTMG